MQVQTRQFFLTPAWEGSVRRFLSLSKQGNRFKQDTYPRSDSLGRRAPWASVAGEDFKYIYNDGNGCTRYDIDVPTQIHGFGPNYHLVGMMLNPEGIADMKDKYFLLNGQSYLDAIGLPTGSAAGWTGGVSGTPCFSGAISYTNPPNWCKHAILTADSDTLARPSQTASLLIVLSASGGPGGVCGQLTYGQRAQCALMTWTLSNIKRFPRLEFSCKWLGPMPRFCATKLETINTSRPIPLQVGGGESLDLILDSTDFLAGNYFCAPRSSRICPTMPRTSAG